MGQGEEVLAFTNTWPGQAISISSFVRKKGGTPGFYSAGYGPNHCSIQFVSEETLQGAGTVGHVQSNVNSMLTGAFPLCGKFGLWITFCGIICQI